ncbi:MAG: pyridoxamine 5'-phosphate oxidase family protein [Egibacteraceae bacterium]
MSLSDRDIEFLKDHHSAAMITVGADGFAKTARVAVVLVDGKLWSSGTHDRVRTERLRKDPRATLFVFEPSSFAWLGIEATVAILDGADVPAQSLRLFREVQGKPTGSLSWFGGDLDEEEFARAMVDERRLIYEFAVHPVPTACTDGSGTKARVVALLRGVQCRPEQPAGDLGVQSTVVVRTAADIAAVVANAPMLDLMIDPAKY